MSQQEINTTRRETFINVRKVAALDIVLHGPGFILAEFAVGVVLIAGVSVFMFFNSTHIWLGAVQSWFFLWLALNYVPLLLYAISIVRHKSAYQEVAYELEHKDRYLLKYTLQASLFLFIPLVMPALAVYQEWQKHALQRGR
jgi:hypothetical protein